jgi:TetR/AcrR family transcriptional regulator, regulator of biofilm formation and stress response
MLRVFEMPKPRRPSPRKQPRAERTRRRVLAAALELLAERGPAAVTHRSVSERADVSLGATTYYFGTKRQLLAEVFRAHLAAVHERVAELVADGAAAAAAAPARAAGLARFLEGAVRDDRLGTLATLELALERARDPLLRRRLQIPAARSDAYAAEMLRRLRSPCPEDDAVLLSAALNGLKLEWLAEGERSAFARRIPALARRLAELFLSAPG